MKADKLNLLKFMEDAQLSVPIYQRPYSWEKRHCRKLWEDIIQAGQPERKTPHFMGSILSIAKDSAAGIKTLHTLIDGQQRITTLALMLIALRNELQTNRLSGLTKELEKIQNQILQNEYLINQEEQGESKYKLRLFIKEDRDIFQHLINGREELPDSKIKQTFDYFTEQLKKCDKNGLETVIRGLNKLEIVSIGLNPSDDDDPQIIFQNLNSAGKPLSQTDLIRNHILMSEKEERQKELYDTYWLPIQGGFSKDEAHFNKFIFHYLTMEEGEVKESEVYEKFKQHMQDQDKEKILANLGRHARHYCYIIGLRQDSETILQKVFSELKQIKPEQTYPFLLKCYDYYEDSNISFTKEDFVKIIHLTISYTIRISICEGGTHGLNKLFASLTHKIKEFIGYSKDKLQEKPLYEYIDSEFATFHGQKRFPNNKRFAQALQTSNIYKSKFTQYLLEKLENHSHPGSFNYKDAKFTIEHIMPQNPNDSWKEDLQKWEEDSDYLYETYLHTLGNLTLADENAKLSNKSFEEKNKGYKDNRIKTLNQDIINQNKWGEEEIKTRAKNLAEKALEIWTKPQTPLQTITAYTIERHFADKNSQPLYEEIKAQIGQLAQLEQLGEVDDEEVKQTFIRLKIGQKEILSIDPHKDFLNLFFHADISRLDDPKGKAEEMIAKHWGTGNTKIKLESLEDIPLLHRPHQASPSTKRDSQITFFPHLYTPIFSPPCNQNGGGGSPQGQIKRPEDYLPNPKNLTLAPNPPLSTSLLKYFLMDKHLKV